MGKQLIDSLRSKYRPTSTLGYDKGRDTIYGEIDIVGDSLRCVYTGLWIHGGPTSAPRTWINNNNFNCEHTWPQSQLPTQAVSDMQHMYATEGGTNNARGNYPFAELTDANTYAWYRYDHYSPPLYAPPSTNADEYSKYNKNTSFEPRDDHKGHVARAMYYILTMYMLADTSADSTWWQCQKDTLYNWHCTHVMDPAESTRTYKVAGHQQGRINPFIMDSTLIRRCYYPLIPANTQVNFAPTAVTKNESDGSFNLTVNISNPSGSSATTVQVVLAGGTGNAADVSNYTTQTVTFPAGSSTPQNVAVTIYDDALIEGTETAVFKLRNVSGGSSAAIGADSAFTLTILDNDTPANTTVSFSPVSASKTEGDAPFNITVAIANPSISTATTADVVLASGTGSAADINNYTTQTVTFPANSSVVQNVAITITDDALVEGTETLVFKLRNVSGGASAAPGADSAYTLTLYDNDVSGPGPFTETMGTVAATTAIATHELNNGFDNDVLTMSGTADVRITTPSSGYTGASGGANIFITNAVGRYFQISGINTTAKAAYVLSFGIYKSTPASNGSELVVEVSSDGISFTPLSVPALPTGTATWYYRTASGTIPSVSNLYIQFRQNGSTPQFRIDDVNLARAMAVELASFTCGLSGNAVTLRWRTESETNSYRWAVTRASTEDGPYVKVAQLDAAGNSNVPREYSWIDNTVDAGVTYYYRLSELDLSGQSAQYGPMSVTVPAMSASGSITGAQPNPFRTRTTISYTMSASSQVSMRIYNAAGQIVRELEQCSAISGINRTEWDGKDRQGRDAMPGVYFYRLTAGNAVLVGRAVLIR